MNTSVSIIGMTASGKSTLGKKLADKMGYTFKDLDREVEKDFDCNVSDMYKKFKPEEVSQHFLYTYNKLVKMDHVVIATGGFFGAFNDLTHVSNIVMLDISLEFFQSRIEEARLNPNTPDNINRRIILKSDEEVIEHYNQRRKLYFKNTTDVYPINSNEDLDIAENQIATIYQDTLPSKTFILKDI